MEENEELLDLEMAKIAEKTNTTGVLVQDQKKELDQHTKEVEELSTTVETTVKAISEAESKLWQLETNRIKLMEEIRQTRQGCYRTGQDIDALNTTLQDCESLYHKISISLASNCDILEIEKKLEGLEKLFNREYENEKRKTLEPENDCKMEIAAREKQFNEVEDDIKQLETENLEEKKVALDKIVEENGVKLKETREEYQKLLCEVDEKRVALKEERLEFAEEEKCLAEKLEEIKKENCKLLDEITSCTEELEKLKEKDTVFSAEIQMEKEEVQKLQASLESVRNESNTLELTEKMAQFRIKQTLETSSFFDFKYDDSLTEQENLEQCKIFLSNEINCLKGQIQEFDLFTKTNEEQVRQILIQKQELENETRTAEVQIEKLKSERLIIELEYNERHLELKHETEKHSKQLNDLKQQVNAKARELELLNDEIKQIESDHNREQKEISEKHSEFDKAIERLSVEKKNLIQQLSGVTENLKKLEKECDDLSYDIVRFENRKAQLIAPEKEAAARFKKPRRFDETSESSIEAYSMDDYHKLQQSHKKVNLNKSKK